MSKSRTLARKGGQSESMERKEWNPQRRKASSKEERGLSKESLLETRKKHERVSGCKSSSGQFAESWFHSKFGQT